MTDYQIQGSTRRCAKTGRDLKPGERFHSALLDEKGAFSRLDYSLEGWEGPPPGAFSHWQGKLPKGDKPRRPPIDDDLLVECLSRLEGDKDPARANFRFVLALLLLTLPHRVGTKSISVMLVAVWLTWAMLISQAANASWGTNQVLPIAAEQAGATGGEPWQEQVVKLAHVAAGIGLLVAWTLLVVGFLKTPDGAESKP